MKLSAPNDQTGMVTELMAGKVCLVLLFEKLASMLISKSEARRKTLEPSYLLCRDMISVGLRLSMSDYQCFFQGFTTRLMIINFQYSHMK